MKVTALSNITHDGVAYKSGDSFEVTKDQEAQLTALGAAEGESQESSRQDSPDTKNKVVAKAKAKKVVGKTDVPTPAAGKDA